jgi:hypothetical protein
MTDLPSRWSNPFDQPRSRATSGIPPSGGSPGSASFHFTRKSWYAVRALALPPSIAYARARYSSDSHALVLSESFRLQLLGLPKFCLRFSAA